jgi:hypothetical protein
VTVRDGVALLEDLLAFQYGGGHNTTHHGSLSSACMYVIVR